MSNYRFAVDVGGTFTDVFVFDETEKKISITKVSSTPKSPEIGIVEGVKQTEVSGNDIIRFSHGTTVGTNALIERKLPKTALVTSKGFRDVIEIRDGTRLDLWDAYNDVAPPYIKRRDRFEVQERTDYAGNILEHIDEDEVRQLGKKLKKRGVESVAICFINAYVNGENEIRVKEILREELGEDVYICNSNDVLPEIFETDRMSTTIINAVLGPTVSNYIHRLEDEMKKLEYEGDILVLHSGGGVMTSETVPRYAARLASSGIAAGAIASKYIASLCGYKNAIGFDMGGTSTDISLMYDGELRITKDWYIEYGYPIGFPSIEILTIGAGGGSISWTDEGGSLRNGPQSAGAEPGPACYGRGGTEPTNTDANVVLGRLGLNLLDGQMSLDKKASEQVIRDSIAKKFDLSIAEAADSILKVANANMCDALRLISVRRGYDPRDFALVAFGGAGGMHGAYLAKEMDIPMLIIPPYSGVAAAMGCLMVDVQHDITKTFMANAKKITVDELDHEFSSMETDAFALLKEEGIAEEDMNFIRYVDMRYAGQWRSLAITVSKLTSMDDILEQFHREHEREFAFFNATQEVEIFGLRVSAIGIVEKPELPKMFVEGTLEDALVEERPVYFEESNGFVKTPVYHRDQLPTDIQIQGPAVINQLDSTILIPPTFIAKVDEYRNILVQY
ncbi:hydantoinase/oxoprolinase family protein [Rummeliibacillus pycnus]|uniref:hydantoinase/oxoprolinase family protein n=1 Tax=Rummeliibacillus pycnus TaxID=101070 RepID=UPI000C99DBCE|nr:hydantoinase/oxoprolinase family protein [Rummeliibacillus pycnus]